MLSRQVKAPISPTDARDHAFPLGAAITLEALDRNPHPLLAELRQREPVSWIPVLGGWLVTRYDDAVAVMRDAERFTVADPRFSTAQVLGPSMLSLDGTEHARHRSPFAAPFRPRAVRRTFASEVAEEATRLITEFEAAATAELRRGFAGPLAAAIIVAALGLDAHEASGVLGRYDSIVGAVTAITAGQPVADAGLRAFAELRTGLLDAAELRPGRSLLASAASDGGLTREELASNAGVLLFGGVETTEGMISNALLHLLERPDLLHLLRDEQERIGLRPAEVELATYRPARRDLLVSAIEESLRMEPAAAVVDRYATRPTTLRGASIAPGDLVRVSIAAANRDPTVFTDPDRFDPHRRNVRRHLAFAQGQHVCLGVHLARLEAQIALRQLLTELPRLRRHPERPSEVRGLVFRKPEQLHAVWT